MRMVSSTSTTLVCAFLLLGAATSSIVAAFSSTRRRHTTSSALTLQSLPNNDCTDSNNVISRRRCMALIRTRIGITTTLLVLTSTASCCAIPPAAKAVVYVDPNRYGDQELQVGVINQVRQLVRDVILQTPPLAPLFLELSIQDALTYDARSTTRQGGPNGRIVSLILQKTCKETAPLCMAAQEVSKIQRKLQRSTFITMADLVALAGAQAIETLGGPRILVPLGKLDGNDEKETSMTIYDLTNGPSTIQAFQKAGLTEREVTLLLGALESMQQVVDSIPLDSTSTNDDNEEENEMGDPQVDFPTSFGGPLQIYGARLGTMKDTIFKDKLAAIQSKQATGVWANEIVGEWTSHYAKGGFFKDLPEAYSRLVKVGSTGRWDA